MKMIEYDIVRDYNINLFIEKVNEKLQQGWKLQGGVCKSWHEPFLQAIYKEVKE